MEIMVIGTGRMGKILAARMASENNILLYDANNASAKEAAAELRLRAVASLTDAKADVAVLAVPDSAVSSCIIELRKTQKFWNVFSVATNIPREMLAKMAGETICCLNVKIIGHAGEMSRGAKPVIVVDEGGGELTHMGKRIFAPVGTVLVGEADSVRQINSVATEEALKASVAIEKALQSAGIKDPVMIRGALSLVAPGVMRAYAEDDLGPFARGIVSALNDKARQ